MELAEATAYRGPKQHRDHYQDASDRIIKALEQGVAPWQKPWDEAITQMQRPCNGHSGRAYRGINVTMLMCRGFADPRWFTFNQIKQRGWSVRRGEKASPVYFYKQVFIPESQLRNKFLLAPRDGDEFDGNLLPQDVGQEIAVADDILQFAAEQVFKSSAQDWTSPSGAQVPVLRTFPMFNAEQIVQGVPNLSRWLGFRDAQWDVNQVAEHTISRLCETTDLSVVTGLEAGYDMHRDRVAVPPRSAFPSATNYYSVVLHEIAHATMHPHRLDRKESIGAAFGSIAYAREELIAEMASMFLCLDLGVPHATDRQSAYVGNWLEILNKDKKEIFRASRCAQHVADYILGHAPEYVQEAVRTRYQQPNAMQSERQYHPAEADPIPEPDPEFIWA
jgi:antirestriction protein ArdC